ncbi:MAG: DNA mismatch endonuclease Vsr [Verrucomicrobiae bacterium]|nr:DNA mismatch endonuclease Vsr [Verrucomicrobiae bacterium]MCP5541163.1 DNA mismatch endonuclease Vsr [Akkermansiaceae bacterium]
MADNWTPEKRSEVMGRVRSRGNKSTEVAMARLLRQFGLAGWRRHLDLPGRPDFAYRREKIAIFVDGCFWHGCPKCYRRPKSNQKFWDRKVLQNQARDRRVNRLLRAKGWKVVRVWEHQLEARERVAKRLQRHLDEARARTNRGQSR